MHAQDHALTDELQDRPVAQSELVFLVIMIVLTGLISLAGVPAGAEKVAGDGSDHLRRDWAAEHDAVVAESQLGRGLREG